MATITKDILKYVENMPYFYVSNLKMLDIPSYYLKIAVNRMFKKGFLFRLKRQCYVSKLYIASLKSEGKYNDYIEYISSKIYEPSYLSLEYVLYENNILTESPQNFTLISKNKTVRIMNGFGDFLYYKVKPALFCGYKVEKRGSFFIRKAFTGKALFDFLYLRKNIIRDKDNLEALRLNIENISVRDKEIFMDYVKLADSKMKKIAGWIYDY